MRARDAVLAGALGAGSLLALVWLGAREEGPRVPGAGSASPAAADGRVAELPRPQVEPRTATRRGVTPEVSTPAVPAPAPAPQDERPIETLPPGEGIQLLVRVKHTGEPVPGAQVTFVDFAALEQRRLAELDDPYDKDLTAGRLGRRFLADEHGIAVVPRSRERAFAEVAWNGLWARTSLGAGAAEPVPIELALGGVLSVSVTGETFATVSKRAPAPARALERTTVRLRIEVLLPFVSARLLARGEPLRDARVRVRHEVRLADSDRELVHIAFAQADREGRVRIVPMELTSLAAWRTLEVAVAADAAGGELAALVYLNPRPTPGENALGDVVLEPMPQLAAGRVVDERGTPVAGASIQAFAAKGSESAEPIWEQLTESATSARNGSFVIAGRSDASLLGLLARHASFVRAQIVPVQRGAQDVVLRLQRAGAIAGHVQCDERWPIEIEARTEDAEGGRERVLPDADTGRFRIERLPAGRYSLDAVLGGHEVVARAEGFDPLDLRGKVRLIEIRVSCADEIPIGQVRFGIRETGSERFSELKNGGASVCLATTRPAVDVFLRAPGHRDMVIPSVAGDREAGFVPGIPVRLVIPEESLPTEGGWGFHVDLLEEGSPPIGRSWAGAQVGPDGVAHLRVGRAGTFSVSLQMVVGHTWIEELPPVPTIRVLDREEPQEFVLDLPASAVAETFAELRRRSAAC